MARPRPWSTIGSPSSGRRLDREARVLAALEHPSIARVYAAGLHRVADGRLLPDMILESVPEGRPITEWCHDQRFDERSRIEALLEVCKAVAHAHERNVVHRDLKPGDVLIDASGNPKLVDFGVAAWSSPMATTFFRGGEGGRHAGVHESGAAGRR
jgi:eukaryotic-like serine/threonine-protein kinase